MLSPQEATKAAVDFLLALPPEFAERPNTPRLEEIEEEGSDSWHVVLSYLTSPSAETMEGIANAFARSLHIQRRFKEFIVDAQSGRVRAMKNLGDA